MRHTLRWMTQPTAGVRSGIKRQAMTALVTGTSILAALTTPVMAQRSAVSGTVVAEATQRPITGAQVDLTGSGRGTVTDANGRFRVEVDAAAGTPLTLRVTMIGYRTVSQTVRANDTDLRIGLVESAITFDAIVVTGTPGGTQRRALGNDVTQVSAARVLEKAPVTDVQQLLGPRVSSVVVMPGSGNVGSGTVTRVRGAHSMSLANEPLIYVDGVRMNNDPGAGPNIRQGRQVNRLNDINPEDIESIEVIKGPAAATLYGTEASNGVIQIITKKGNSGRAIIDVVVQQGANWIMNLDSKLPLVYGKNTTGQVVSLNLLEQEKAAGRNPFQTGPVQSYGASVRGGSP